MPKGKEISAANKDGSAAGTKDVKAPQEKKDVMASKSAAQEKPAEGPKIKVESKPKTELELAREEVAALKAQLKKTTEELQEWKDKHLYLQAEFDNADKRRAKIMDGQRKRMQADMVFAFLPLVDSLTPAVRKIDEGAYKDVKTLGEGLRSIKQQLDNILKGLNVTPIDQVNIPFDYNLHEVTISQERPDLPDETVLSIVQVGWKLGSDVIRPAKVVVSKKPCPPAPVPVTTSESTCKDKKVVDIEHAKLAPPDAGKQQKDIKEVK